jgi:hypothetical protein
MYVTTLREKNNKMKATTTILNIINLPKWRLRDKNDQTKRAATSRESFPMSLRVKPTQLHISVVELSSE